MIGSEERDGVLVWTLEHGKANALDLEFLEALESALEAEAAPETPLVITGRGSIFSAGVDLKRLLDEGDGYVGRFLPLLDAVLLRLFERPGPTVAAVNGHAIAGGCILAACADHRVGATGRSRHGVPELRVGVPFPPAALEILRAAVGDRRLGAVVLDGDTFGPEEALAMGLLDELAPPEACLTRACEVARSRGEIPTEAHRITKDLLRRETGMRARRGLEESGAAVLAAWTSAPVRSAIERFVSKTL